MYGQRPAPPRRFRLSNLPVNLPVNLFSRGGNSVPTLLLFAPMPEGTLFDRIIRGELRSHRVYEDDRVFAFLDIAPQSPGHVLVVPKESCATVGELSDESAAAVGRVLPRLARAIAAAVGRPHLNILQNNGGPAGQAVPHVHFHLIPRVRRGNAPGSGLETVWKPGSLREDDGERISGKIRAALADSSGDG